MFLAAAALLVGSVAQAQSYGDQSQVLTIGVSQFRGIAGSPSEIEGDYYLYNSIPGSYYYYLAPLALPEGALIESVCLFGRDTDDEFLFYVQAYLFANKLVPIGESPATLQVPGSSAFSSGSAGYGSWCSEPMSYTLRARLDVDGDGTVDDAVHYVGLFLPHSISGRAGFRRRQDHVEAPGQSAAVGAYVRRCPGVPPLRAVHRGARRLGHHRRLR